MRRATTPAMAIATVAFALAAAGCRDEPSPVPSGGSPTASSLPTPTAASAATASPSSSPAGVVWDDGLLAVLPSDIAGLPLVPEPDAFAASASDPGLLRDASAGAVAFIVDPAGEDYAVAFVYELRPGVFDDAWYRGWRDSFDEGVCDQAGAVTGKAEAELGGRTVHIGSCTGGVFTYHATLTTEGGDLVVSVQSLGDGRLGQRLMEGLRP